MDWAEKDLQEGWWWKGWALLCYPGTDKLLPLSTAALLSSFLSQTAGRGRVGRGGEAEWVTESVDGVEAAVEHLLLPLLALLPQQSINHVDDPLLPGTHLAKEKWGSSWAGKQAPVLAELLLRLPPHPLLPCSAPQLRRHPSFSFPTHLAAFSSSLSYEEWFMLGRDIPGSGSLFVFGKMWNLPSECKQNLCLKQI